MRKIFFVIFLGAAFFGCKKYPEDDRRYWFKSPMARLSGKNSWYLTKYYIDNADSTYVFFNRYVSIDPDLAGSHQIPLGKTNSNKNSMGFASIIGKGSFEFVSKKNFLKITISVNTGYYNPFLVDGGEWEIRGLTEKVLKIRATVGVHEYYLIFT